MTQEVLAGQAVLTLMLGYKKFKTKTGPNPNLAMWSCDLYPFGSDRTRQHHTAEC